VAGGGVVFFLPTCLPTLPTLGSWSWFGWVGGRLGMTASFATYRGGDTDTEKGEGEAWLGWRDLACYLWKHSSKSGTYLEF
jgi:hypothetical protein